MIVIAGGDWTYYIQYLRFAIQKARDWTCVLFHSLVAQKTTCWCSSHRLLQHNPARHESKKQDYGITMDIYGFTAFTRGRSEVYGHSSIRSLQVMFGTCRRCRQWVMAKKWWNQRLGRYPSDNMGYLPTTWEGYDGSTNERREIMGMRVTIRTITSQFQDFVRTRNMALRGTWYGSFTREQWWRQVPKSSLVPKMQVGHLSTDSATNDIVISILWKSIIIPRFVRFCFQNSKGSVAVCQQAHPILKFQFRNH